MNTVGGLQIHMSQVHKTEIKVVDNAIPGRDSVDIEIFGMEGVPLADLMKRGTVTQGAPAKVSAPRADMHQNTDELLRQLADFRESKKVAALAPTVVSSVVQEYAPAPPIM
jgi:hypothetical protein